MLRTEDEVRKAKRPRREPRALRQSLLRSHQNRPRPDDPAHLSGPGVERLAPLSRVGGPVIRACHTRLVTALVVPRLAIIRIARDALLLRAGSGLGQTQLFRGLEEEAHHLEHAGHEELAANYFTATQAMAKIKRVGGGLFDSNAIKLLKVAS